MFGATPPASGLSAAGVYSANSLESNVSVYIDGNGAQGINAASVELDASDNSTITALSEAVAVSIGLSMDDGAAKSVGAGWATNLIDTNSSAYIVNVTNIDAGGVVVSTEDARNIKSQKRPQRRLPLDLERTAGPAGQEQEPTPRTRYLAQPSRMLPTA